MTGRNDFPECRVKALALFPLLLASMPMAARAQGTARTITTVAGTEHCSNLTTDPAGNVYFTDGRGIRKLAPGTGKLTNIDTGDLQAAGIAVDAAGNLYLAQSEYGSHSNTVQKMAAGTGAITTVAGTGEIDRGVGKRIPGPATQAILAGPQTVALDSAGNLYIAENGVTTSQFGMFRVDAATGIIANVPMRLDVDQYGLPVDRTTNDVVRAERRILAASFAFDPDGNLYFSDHSLPVIWKVAVGGHMTRFAGTGQNGYSGENGPATLAKLYSPFGLAFDGAGNLYIADVGNNRIRMVAKDSGMISTVAGNGTAGSPKANDGDGGPAMQASIDSPEGVVFDHVGNLYICSGILRKVTGMGSASAR